MVVADVSIPATAPLSLKRTSVLMLLSATATTRTTWGTVFVCMTSPATGEMILTGICLTILDYFIYQINPAQFRETERN